MHDCHDLEIGIKGIEKKIKEKRVERKILNLHPSHPEWLPVIMQLNENCLTRWALRPFQSFHKDKQRRDGHLSAQILVHVCWLYSHSLVGRGTWGREGRLPALPSHPDPPKVSPPPITCFSGWGPPPASFLRDLGAGLPQRVGILDQPGGGTALVSAAEQGFSTGLGGRREGKRDTGCSLQWALRGSTRQGQGQGPNASISLRTLWANH